MNRQVDLAVVLRRVNYGEADRVVTLLTQKQGKISVFAKAVRKSKSRMCAGIELLTVSEVTFIGGKTQLYTLSGATVKEQFSEITQDIAKTNVVFEALKRIDSLCEDGTGQEYFELLRQCMARLANEAYDARLVEAWFRLRILHISGVLAAVDVRGETEELNGDGYRFNYEDQVFEAHEAGEFSRNDIKLLRLLGASMSPVRLQSELGSEARLAQFTRTLFSMNLA